MSEIDESRPYPEFHPVWGHAPRKRVPRWRTSLKRAMARMFAFGRSAADPRRGVAILAYHGTSDDPSDPWWVDFRGQMDLIADLGYRVVGLAEAVAIVRSGKPPERPTLTLTFDDGYANNLDSAFAELSRRGWPASVFLASSFIGRRPYLLDHEARSLVDFGVEVGNHTHSHVNARRLGAREVRAEIDRCQRRLTELVGYAPRHFVFPDGAYSPAACKVIEEAGLDGACTGRIGFNGPGTDPYRLRRLTIERGDGPDELKTRLRGGYDFLDARQRYMDLEPPHAASHAVGGSAQDDPDPDRYGPVQ